MSTLARAVVLLSWVVLCTIPISAQEAIVCRDMDQVLAEIRQLKKLIENQGKINVQNTTVRVNATSAPSLGSKSAPLTVVEFTDYQCPFCQRFFLQTFPDFKKKYIDTGVVRFYSMDLPLSVHRNALQAAQAGHCAGDQDGFWGMHDRMQAHPQNLEMSDLVSYAKELGMRLDDFRECIEGGKYKEAIQADAARATSDGASGTPAFVIGKSTPDGVEGELVIGALPLGAFEQKLVALMQ